MKMVMIMNRKERVFDVLFGTLLSWSHIYVLLIVGILFFIVGDIVTTWVGIEMFNAIEKNQFLNNQMEQYGVFLGIAIFKLLWLLSLAIFIGVGKLVEVVYKNYVYEFVYLNRFIILSILYIIYIYGVFLVVNNTYVIGT